MKKRLLDISGKEANLNITLLILLIVASFLLGILITKVQYLSLRSQLATVDTPVKSETSKQTEKLTRIQNKVINKNGYKFKIVWNNLGKKMIDDGVIDEKKLAQSIVGKDGFTKDFKKYLDGSDQTLVLTPKNSHFWLNVLWGLGLANKNRLLDEGDMVKNGDPASFASTGGYTLGNSDAMNYYSKYSYITLTPSQQAEVEEIAGNIYRPCCGNSAAFPDCNHGMAMLGLIELMVSQNFSKEETYNAALAFNTYWFPQTYLNIAYYFETNGKDYSKISSKEILSSRYSSSEGNAKMQQQTSGIVWPNQDTGGGCGA